jgi:polysaccharide biosynthesis transport protein
MHVDWRGLRMSASERMEQVRDGDGLYSALRILRRHWMLVVGVVSACVLVGIVHHITASKSYAATASVTFQNGTLSESALQVSPAGGVEPQRQAATETLIAHSPEVARNVARELGVSNAPSELLGLVKVESAPNADVLDVTATTGNPGYAARVANAFAKQYIAFRTASQLAGVERAQSALQRQIAGLPVGSPERATLQQSLQRLMELRAVAGGGASIIGMATPPSEPLGMRLSTTLMFSAIIGLAIAFALVFLLETLDRRLKSIEEFELEYRLPVLAVIPHAGSLPQPAEKRGEALEPYRILRSALDLAAVTQPLDTLLITSAVSGEGKTTVAVDLAHAIALTGRRVALVELDLRRPNFSSHFNLDSQKGFTTVFTGDESISDLLERPFPDLDNLSVLPSGPPPPNPSELLGSPRVVDMLAEVSSSHEIVIIDAPPLNPVADAQVLLDNSAIQAVLIVARADLTTREQARRARAILDFHTAEPVGVVITGLRDVSHYGYGRYEPAEPAEARTPAPNTSGAGFPRHSELPTQSTS